MLMGIRDNEFRRVIAIPNLSGTNYAPEFCDFTLQSLNRSDKSNFTRKLKRTVKLTCVLVKERI